MPAIYEGIKNRIFVKEDIEQIAAIRWSICQQCSQLDRKGNKCTIPCAFTTFNLQDSIGS